MPDTQPYSFHKAPSIMGLTQFDWQDFFDLLAKANKPQIEAMLIEIQKEIKKRIEAKNW